MEKIIALIIQYKYLALFPLAAIEGPLVSLAVGFVIYLGYLNFLPAYVILLFGDLIPDSIYYYIGRFGRNKNILSKYTSKSGSIFSNFSIVEKIWEHHPRKTMFLSKLAYGLSTPFLISAGLANMHFKKFLSLAVPVTIIQYLIIMAVGFYMGHSYDLAEKYLKFGQATIAIILMALLVGYFFVSKYARKIIITMEKKENNQ